MPENVGNKAFTTAQTIASENGFTDGSNGVTITTAAGKLPNQLKVTVSINTKNPWGAMVGYNNTTIVRSAVAEYQLPQNLGSPQNTLRERSGVGARRNRSSGGTSSGRRRARTRVTRSSRRDRLAARRVCNADNCPSSVNKDYDATGYFYGIDVPAGSTGALNVQVYDPAFVHVGDNCGDSDANAKSEPEPAATLTAAQIPGYTGTITPAVRYASAGSSSRSATATTTTPTAATPPNPWTTWTLRAPDVSTWDPTNNPIVCQAEFPGVYPETTQRPAERHGQRHRS